MEAQFQITSTGKRKDLEGVILFDGTPTEVRRWAVIQLVCDRQNGNSKSAVFLNGKRLKPSGDEIQAVETSFAAALAREAASDSVSTDRPKGPRKRPRPAAPAAPLSLRERRRRLRARR